MQMRVNTVFSAALCTALALSSTTPAHASCTPPPPPDCAIDSQFASGRWDISQISGTHTLSGLEEFDVYEDEVFLDPFQTDGALTVQMLGGPEENYLEVACDGSVSGMGHERISGTIEKVGILPDYYDPDYCFFTPYDMTWTVTIERRFSISGDVVGSGQLELDLDVEEATIDLSGNYAWSDDCVFSEDPIDPPLVQFDLSGDIEEVRFSGPYDPLTQDWQPTITPRGARTWVDDVLHRLQLTGANPLYNPWGDPLVLLPPDTPQTRLTHNQYFVTNPVMFTDDVSLMAAPKTPVITELALDEPQQYIENVSVMTTATATVDWRDADGSRIVDFTYGGMTTPVTASGDTATFMFDAGDSATSISALARAGDEQSQPYEINTPKVPLPGWAGTVADWQGSPGVTYDGDIDWPISLQTTQTINSISLFSGIWGVTGSAQSSYLANAQSNGSPSGGSLTTTTDFSFPGKSVSMTVSGSNQTTLQCDQMTTTGTANVSIPPANWKKVINPLSAIPGLISAACGIHQSLCSVVSSFGITGRAQATLGGSADFEGNSGPMMWTGGSVDGSLSAAVSASALPRPLSSIANVSVGGGGTGCINIAVVPDFMLNTVGGEVVISATLSFLGFSTSPTETITFGAGCGARVPELRVRGVSNPWVPADGQLAMALSPFEAGSALAAWTEPHIGQSKPSGDILIRFMDDGEWGPIIQLTDDFESDIAPALAYVDEQTVLLVFQRNLLALPTDVAQLDSYADGYDIYYMRINTVSGSVVGEGYVTTQSGNDFGPQLVRATDGSVHVFWQASVGGELFGTPSAPVQIHVASFDGVAFDSTQLVADDLHYTFGWTAAAFDANDQLVAMTLDTNENMGDADDREIAVVRKVNGSWLVPIDVTSNASADDAPNVVFDANGEATLLWRNDGQVMQASGDLTQATVAFSAADVDGTDGIDAQFHGAQFVSGMAGQAISWSDGTEVHLARRLTFEDPLTAWSQPEVVVTGDQTHQPLALLANGATLRVGYTAQSFTADGTALEQLLELVIGEVPFGPCDGIDACGPLLADGFEPGTDALSLDGSITTESR